MSDMHDKVLLLFAAHLIRLQAGIMENYQVENTARLASRFARVFMKELKEIEDAATKVD